MEGKQDGKKEMLNGKNIKRLVKKINTLLKEK